MSDSNLYSLSIDPHIIFAIQELTKVQAKGVSALGPRLREGNVAKEILEVAIIERFEATFHMTIGEAMRRKTCAGKCLPVTPHKEQSNGTQG